MPEPPARMMAFIGYHTLSVFCTKEGLIVGVSHRAPAKVVAGRIWTDCSAPEGAISTYFVLDIGLENKILFYMYCGIDL